MVLLKQTTLVLLVKRSKENRTQLSKAPIVNRGYQPARSFQFLVMASQLAICIAIRTILKDEV
jgi:hypothetical protein